MSKPSSPALAFGCCAVLLMLAVWNPRAGRVPPVDPGPPPRCAPDARLVGRVCLAPTQPEAAVTVAPDDAATATPAARASTHDEVCHLLTDGSLKRDRLFGDGRASQVYVSYRTAGEVDHDVLLPGGTWHSDERIEEGHYWVYAGCSDEEIAEKVAAYRLSVSLSIPGSYAGPGDAHLFNDVPGTVLEPAPVQRLD
jgi:hypothetical protein